MPDLWLVDLFCPIKKNFHTPPLYTALKTRLLDAHQLTDYQRVDQLLKMGDLGARQPSELLAAMLELCPRGQETSLFFTHLFLCCLPAELRIMLGEDDYQDVRLLITKADKLWARHGQKFHLVAAVEQPVEDALVSETQAAAFNA